MKKNQRAPLRRIVEVLRYAETAFDRQKVRLECGHVVFVSGGAIYRGRCRKCADETPKPVIQSDGDPNDPTESSKS